MTGARGEGVIHLANRDVTVLFTNRALMDAERQIGKSILDVLDGFTRNTSGITELAYLLLAGMQAARREDRGGPAVRIQDALAVLDEAGFAAVATVVMEAVAAVLSYGTSEGEENPNP